MYTYIYIYNHLYIYIYIYTHISRGIGVTHRPPRLGPALVDEHAETKPQNYIAISNNRLQSFNMTN